MPGTSRVGTYPIVAANCVDPNYTIHLVPGTLSITPAALTITAKDEFVPVGSSPPQLTADYAGLVNGDSPASLSAPVQLSAPDPARLSPGSYPIVASSASSPDYQHHIRERYLGRHSYKPAGKRACAGCYGLSDQPVR